MRRRPWLVLAALTAIGAAGSAGLAQRSEPIRAGWGGPAEVAYDGRFVFVRMSYEEGLSGFGRGRGREAWAHDYPVGEANFMQILSAVSSVSANLDETSVLAFDDPDLFRFPVIYLVEPGYWLPSEPQVTALRDYLTKGGFLIVDDFPAWAWDNFATQMARVFPAARWIDLNGTPAHPIFHTFYEVDANQVATLYDLGGQPSFRALFADNDPGGRLQVVANYQNDLSEYWEFSHTGMTPVDETNEAYKFGVNEFIYGITH